MGRLNMCKHTPKPWECRKLIQELCRPTTDPPLPGDRILCTRTCWHRLRTQRLRINYRKGHSLSIYPSNPASIIFFFNKARCESGIWIILAVPRVCSASNTEILLHFKQSGCSHCTHVTSRTVCDSSTTSSHNPAAAGSPDGISSTTLSSNSALAGSLDTPPLGTSQYAPDRTLILGTETADPIMNHSPEMRLQGYLDFYVPFATKEAILDQNTFSTGHGAEPSSFSAPVPDPKQVWWPQPLARGPTHEGFSLLLWPFLEASFRCSTTSPTV